MKNKINTTSLFLRFLKEHNLFVNWKKSFKHYDHVIYLTSTNPIDYINLHIIVDFNEYLYWYLYKEIWLNYLKENTK